MYFKPAIASMSLGRAWHHNIHPKFHAAATAGLPGIEIFFEDLIYLASTYEPPPQTPYSPHSPPSPTRTSHLLAAHEIRRLATSLSLTIIACGPFSNCEGLLSASAKKEKLVELQLWFEICHILKTDLIQIPCTFQTEGLTGDLKVVAEDLRAIADLGAAQSPPFRFAFENLCFGTYFDTWEGAWTVVTAVDRENFGLCLDTYNIAGREYGDPTSPDGVTAPDAAERFTESMRQMAREIDARKVFYVQVVDGERVQGVLERGHEFFVEGQKPRMSWSRNARLFVCEEERGGYLPVLEVVRAVMGSVEEGGLGYKGWVSMELFNRSLCVSGEEMPREHANRAVGSWKRLCRRMGWADDNLVKEDAGKNVLVDEGVDMGEYSKNDLEKFVGGKVEEIEISSRL